MLCCVNAACVYHVNANIVAIKQRNGIIWITFSFRIISKCVMSTFLIGYFLTISSGCFTKMFYLNAITLHLWMSCIAKPRGYYPNKSIVGCKRAIPQQFP